MKSYNFTIVLSGLDTPTEEFVDGLFEVGCNDGTLGFRDGIGYIEFERKARSFEEAILGAIEQVERVDRAVVVEEVLFPLKKP